jgi:5-methylcytosine-specific restriction endonuclease McrA
VSDERKVCNTCGILRPLGHFRVRNRRTGARANKCRECQPSDLLQMLKYAERRARERAQRLGCRIEPVSYAAILLRDGKRCYLCGGVIDPGYLTFEHVVPLVKGGPHAESNIYVAHKGCNQRKGGRYVRELHLTPDRIS